MTANVEKDSFQSKITFEKVAKVLGSIKLAVPLLVIIASILIGATFYEAEVGSAVVQQEIYKSPWFGALMFLLAVNLGVSTLLRYPWKGARKIGFVITHWGLVVIIAGSAAVIHLSVEGMMLAREDAGPVSTIRVDGDLIEVARPDGSFAQSPLFIKADSTVVPSHVGDLSLLGYSDNTINTVHFEAGEQTENPAVRLVLRSDRMGQSLERWLAVAPVAYDSMDIGPASLQIVKAESKQVLAAALSEPKVSAQPAQTTARWGNLSLSWLGESQIIDVEKNLHQPVDLVSKNKNSESSEVQKLEVQKLEVQKLTAEVVGFWPDFRLDADRKPTTATDQLRNPAIQLKLSNNETVESWFVFGKPGFEPIRTQVEGEAIALGSSFSLSYNVSPDSLPGSLTNEHSAFFRVVVDESGSLHYAAKSSKGFISGPIAVGDSVIPGWADFEVTLAEYIPRANVAREIVPVPKDSPEQGSPALLVSTSKTSEPVWVGWGEPTTVKSEQGDWYVAFSPKLLQLPFGLKLNNFIVERNEGSESVAMWTSDVSLIDLKTPEPQIPEVSRRRVWMNHPTWFKGWKIAQASWNPGDLSQSTLQVKREPWWVTGLTWLGSTMVTVGVATMFYGRAVAKRFNKFSNLLASSNLETPDEKETDEGTIPIFNALLGR